MLKMLSGTMHRFHLIIRLMLVDSSWSVGQFDSEQACPAMRLNADKEVGRGPAACRVLATFYMYRWKYDIVIFNVFDPSNGSLQFQVPHELVVVTIFPSASITTLQT